MQFFYSGEGLLSHDEVEVLEGDLFSIGGCTLQHLSQLVSRHRLAQLLRNSSQIMHVDSRRAVIVEELENAGDTLTALFVAKLVSDSLKELLEVDSICIFVGVQVRNHGVDSWVLALEAQRRHGGFQFARVNSAIAVCVEKGEGFADFLNFVLGQAWALEHSASDGRSLASSCCSSLSSVHCVFSAFCV